MIYSLDFILIFIACVLLLLLILNIETRINLLALAILLFFITFLTGCADMTPEKAQGYAVVGNTVLNNGIDTYAKIRRTSYEK